jgi:hypothetical protein
MAGVFRTTEVCVAPCVHDVITECEDATLVPSSFPYFSPHPEKLTMSNYIRTLVSGNKARFKDKDLDLDLGRDLLYPSAPSHRSRALKT